MLGSSGAHTNDVRRSDQLAFARPYPRLPAWLLGGLALLLVGGCMVRHISETTPTTIQGRPATAQEARELRDLVQRAQTIRFPARRTGDVSAFPTLFSDDPNVRLHADWYAMFDQQRARADALLTSVGLPAPRWTPGFLTLVTIETLQLHADGPPYWAGPAKPVTVSQIEVRGSHAGAIVRLAEGGGTFEHYVFTRVAGQWTFSSIWTDCDPGGCA
jgi:hypothetical protein